MFETPGRLAFSLSSTPALAQGPIPFTTGLMAPTKLVVLENQTILVAEAGQGPNTGRVSIVEPNVGRRHTLIEGLPSGLAPPQSDPSGPAGLLSRGQRLYIAIGEGDAGIPGAAPGTVVPNPTPSSPLFSSILQLEFEPEQRTTEGGFSLSLGEQERLANGEEFYVCNHVGECVKLWMVANLPDFVAEPRPGAPNNVRMSNLFGMIGGDTNADVVDAGMDAVWRVELGTGAVSQLARFPSQPNPLPIGPPMIDAVPTSVRELADDDEMIVSLLPGFPFPPSVGVLKFNLADGSQQPLISGLRMTTDVLPVPGSPGTFYVLQFSTDPLAGAPGSLLRFDSPTAAPVLVARGLITPTSLAINPRTEDLLVTELATGRIVSIRP